MKKICSQHVLSTKAGLEKNAQQMGLKSVVDCIVDITKFPGKKLMELPSVAKILHSSDVFTATKYNANTDLR